MRFIFENEQHGTMKLLNFQFVAFLSLLDSSDGHLGSGPETLGQSVSFNPLNYAQLHSLSLNHHQPVRDI